MVPKSVDFFIKCRNRWFFDFCYTSAVKTSLFKVHGCKINHKSVKHQCKIEAQKSDAQMMKQGTKMEPKWEPKLVQNRKNAGKMGSEK
jgi:hypothetical protein